MRIKKMTKRAVKNQSGLTLIELLIIIGLIGALITLGLFVLSNERARVRDSQRIADMARVQAAFQLIYFEKASYKEAAAGCSSLGDDVNQCGLGNYLNGLGRLRDPGRYRYQISRVPDDSDYGVVFTLERTYGGLKAGQHVLSKNGIK